MTGKPRKVLLAKAPGRPFTAKERRGIEKRVERREKWLRRRYKEVHGKRVDWISHAVEESSMYFTVRFTDKTAFHLQVTPELAADRIQLSDWKTGNDRILRTYYRRRDS